MLNWAYLNRCVSTQCTIGERKSTVRSSGSCRALRRGEGRSEVTKIRKGQNLTKADAQVFCRPRNQDSSTHLLINGVCFIDTALEPWIRPQQKFTYRYRSPGPFSMTQSIRSSEDWTISPSGWPLLLHPTNFEYATLLMLYRLLPQWRSSHCATKSSTPY